MTDHSEPRGSVAAHRDAEKAMADMDRALARGDYLGAAQAAERAAAFELEALQAIPVERERTRTLIAISASSLAEHAVLFRSKASQPT
jgi:hypothetical protein